MKGKRTNVCQKKEPTFAKKKKSGSVPAKQKTKKKEKDNIIEEKQLGVFLSVWQISQSLYTRLAFLVLSTLSLLGVLMSKPFLDHNQAPPLPLTYIFFSSPSTSVKTTYPHPR